MPRGPEKNGGQAAQALGRSRGGFSTKLHAGCLDEQTSVACELTSGARHDAPVFEAVLDQCPALPQLTDVVMDRGYDSDQIRQHLRAQEVTPVIPPKRNRKKPISYDPEHYQLREKVERFFKDEPISPDRDALRETAPHVPRLYSSGRPMDHGSVIRQHNLILPHKNG